MYVVIQYALDGVISHEIVSERDITDEIGGFPVWRGSAVAVAEDHRQAGLLADFHADMAERARREAYARSVTGPRGTHICYRNALADAEGLRGPDGLARFRSWWHGLACHCTFHDTWSAYCVPPGGYHRRECPIYGTPR